MGFTLKYTDLQTFKKKLTRNRVGKIEGEATLVIVHRF
jgi:hypothetical protein